MELPPTAPRLRAIFRYTRDCFTLFPRLPIEIRLRIWHLALQGPKILRLSCFGIKETKFRCRVEIPGICAPFHMSTWNSYKVPPLFHVCRESRFEAFKAYQLFDLKNENRKINLNFAADIILPSYPEDFNSYRLDVMLYIQHVAFDLSTLVRGEMALGCTLALLQQFPVLKTFAIFVDTLEIEVLKSCVDWQLQSKTDQCAMLAVGVSSDEKGEVGVAEDMLKGLGKRYKELERGAHCPFHLYKRKWNLPEMRIIKPTMVGFRFHDVEIQDVEIGEQIWEKQGLGEAGIGRSRDWEKQGLGEEPCHCEHGRPVSMEEHGRAMRLF